MPYTNNKGADQPAHPRSLICAFVVRCLDSIIPLLSISEISSLYLVSVTAQTGLLNGHLFGKELFIRLTANAFRKLPSIYVFSYFPFGFEGRIRDLIVSVPDNCLSFYFVSYLVVNPEDMFSRDEAQFMTVNLIINRLNKILSNV